MLTLVTLRRRGATRLRAGRRPLSLGPEDDPAEPEPFD